MSKFVAQPDDLLRLEEMISYVWKWPTMCGNDQLCVEMAGTGTGAKSEAKSIGHQPASEAGIQIVISLSEPTSSESSSGSSVK